MPVRIQRQRTKGWRMPEGAVYVGRPTKWGNPFRAVREGSFQTVVDHTGRRWRRLVCSTDRRGVGREMRQAAVDLYRWRVALIADPIQLADLAGKDLACWCPLDQPCHADVLLEIANGGGV